MNTRRTKITIKAPNFSRLKMIMKDEMDRASQDITNHLSTWIEINTGNGGSHYQERDGPLKKATKVTGSLDKEIRLFIDRRMVKYGEWILSGKRRGKNGIVTWNNGKGDPYIDECILANQKWIDDRVEKAIGDSLVRFKNEPLREVK